MANKKMAVFDVSSPFVAKAMDEIKADHPDSLLVLAPFSGSLTTHAPAKKGKAKGYFRIQCEIWLPEDAIEGADALNDFGAFVIMRLPKARVKSHLGGEAAHEPRED